MIDWMTGEARCLLINENPDGSRPDVSHYASVEDALHDLRWGEVGHRVNRVTLKRPGHHDETISEDEFRARYLPPARG